MEGGAGNQNSSMPPVSNAREVIRFFREELVSGKNWYVALLESIGRWTDETENEDGRTYSYLIDGEAFDWLLLAERLCRAVDGLVPEKEKAALLFHGRPPADVPAEDFKKLVGTSKYRRHLNYFYGVVVEEAILLSVREEVRKERRASGLSYRRDEEDESYQRIYDCSEAEMLKQFRRSKGHPLTGSTSLTELREFAYWRFKYRIKACEKAKVASDTQKGLDWLRQTGCKYKA
jgi:hypothetical protein